MSAMIPIYVRLIREGRRTLEQVPEVIRDQVRQALEEAEKDENEGFA